MDDEGDVDAWGKGGGGEAPGVDRGEGVTGQIECGDEGEGIGRVGGEGRVGQAEECARGVPRRGPTAGVGRGGEYETSGADRLAEGDKDGGGEGDADGPAERGGGEHLGRGEVGYGDLGGGEVMPGGIYSGEDDGVGPQACIGVHSRDGESGERGGAF